MHITATRIRLGPPCHLNTFTEGEVLSAVATITSNKSLPWLCYYYVHGLVRMFVMYVYHEAKCCLPVT